MEGVDSRYRWIQDSRYNTRETKGIKDTRFLIQFLFRCLPLVEILIHWGIPFRHVSSSDGMMIGAYAVKRSGGDLAFPRCSCLRKSPFMPQSHPVSHVVLEAHLILAFNLVENTSVRTVLSQTVLIFTVKRTY
ncbi:uncharacterized protein METZ01_LOCUS344723 [marine metagenome]|uniref:Uncharacterized protein n=1 Tax=marine metagenome TaxID=408172 RepID=A0A382R286_9ZZZZ